MKNKVTIEKAENGYIVLHESEGFSGLRIYKTLSSLKIALSAMLEPENRLMSLSEVVRESNDRSNPDIF